MKSLRVGSWYVRLSWCYKISWNTLDEEETTEFVDTLGSFTWETSPGIISPDSLVTRKIKLFLMREYSFKIGKFKISMNNQTWSWNKNASGSSYTIRLLKAFF